MPYLSTHQNISSSFSYSKFTTYLQYESALAALKADYPDLIDYYTDRTSAVGNYALYWMTLGDVSKPAIFLEGTLHGRHEWHSAHIILEYIRKMCDPADNQHTFATDLLQRYCIVAVPLVNPWGYMNSRYTNGHKRITDPNYPNTEGVNLNRNFDRNWSGIPYETDYHYKGPSPLSEPETQLIGDILQNKGYTIGAYISLHNMGGSVVTNPANYSSDVQYAVAAYVDPAGASQHNAAIVAAFSSMLNRVETRQGVSITGTKTVSELAQDGMSYGWAQASLNIPAVVFELGISYSQSFASDMYLEALYSYAEILEPEDLILQRTVNNQSVKCVTVTSDTAGTQLRIYDNGVEKYFPLVAANSPDASAVRFFDGSQTWAVQSAMVVRRNSRRSAASVNFRMMM